MELKPGLSLAAAAGIARARILRGDPGLLLRGLATLASAGPADLSFLSDSRYATQARDTAAGAIIAREADAAGLPAGCAVLASDDPYRAFAMLARELEALLRPASAPGREPSAVVAPDALIGSRVSIGAQAVIGAGARVGDGATIGPGSVIGAGASIGAGTMLHARVTVYDRCTIGERCIVHAGAVIGADGFGFAPAEGRWEKIPQLGAVRIGNDVEIGANTTIDRGALDDTVIGDGCKLDNQIQIGHNVRIGEHSALAGCVGVAGSAVIGRRCRIGGGAGILGHLEICDDVTVSAMSLVTRTIRQPGFYTGVFPLMDNDDWERAAAVLRRLPELRTRVRRLERTDEDNTR
jgi:UDP-3-O-[3-hydroxymyristoyl] glucosamine N-acyltransferase